MKESAQALQETVQAIEEEGEDKILSLRLDLNLALEVTITAKIQGDLTLSLSGYLQQGYYSLRSLRAY